MLAELLGLRCGGGLFSKRHDVGGLVVAEDSKAGEGGFATVWRCRALSGRGYGGEVPAEYVALKKTICADEDRRATALSEAEVLRGTVDQPGPGSELVARYLGHAEVPAVAGARGQVLVVLEWCARGTLLDRVLGDGGAVSEPRCPNVEEAVAVRMLKEVSCALRYLHWSRGIVHYDLKPENILYCADSSTRLCDFGSASSSQWPDFCRETSRGVVRQVQLFLESRTTPMFRPPELADPDLARLPITGKADMFMLGLCLFQALFAVHAFPAEGRLANLNATFSVPAAAEASYSPAVLATLRALLRREPEERPGPEELHSTGLLGGQPGSGGLASVAPPAEGPAAEGQPPASAPAGSPEAEARGAACAARDSAAAPPAACDAPTEADPPVVTFSFRQEANLAVGPGRPPVLPLPRGASSYVGSLSHRVLGERVPLELRVDREGGRWCGEWFVLDQVEPVSIELMGQNQVRIVNTDGQCTTTLCGTCGADGTIRGDLRQGSEGGGCFELHPVSTADPRSLAEPALPNPPWVGLSPGSDVPPPSPASQTEAAGAAVMVAVSGRLLVFSKSRSKWLPGDILALVVRAGRMAEDPGAAAQPPAPAGAVWVRFQPPGEPAMTKIVPPEDFGETLRPCEGGPAAGPPGLAAVAGDVSVLSRSRRAWLPGRLVRLALRAGRTDAGEALPPGAVHVCIQMGADARGDKWLPPEEFCSCLRPPGGSSAGGTSRRAVQL